MNHLWRGKAFTIPGPVLNYGGGIHWWVQLMPVPPPKNPGCPNFGVGMPHARSGGDALRIQHNLFNEYISSQARASPLQPLHYFRGSGGMMITVT
jgi:hypothetical protein